MAGLIGGSAGGSAYQTRVAIVVVRTLQHPLGLEPPNHHQDAMENDPFLAFLEILTA